MNKKKEIHLRRRVNKLSATFFALVLVFSACKKEETTIGADFEDGSLNVITQDTFSVISYSEEITEMVSSERGVSLLGAYNDPIFGGVNCGIVTQIVPNDLDPDFTGLGVYTMDSVVLALRYTSINYYANLDDIVVEIFEIDDVLTRDNEDYLISETPTLLDGSNNLVLNEGAEIKADFVSNSIVGNDTLPPQMRIHLDTQVGEDLVTDAIAGQMGANFQTATFKGIYIRVATTDDDGFGFGPGLGTVLYFSMEDFLSKMTIYYHREDGVAGEYDFKIDVTTARYNKIEYKRDGTIVQDLLADETLGEEAFYMQAGSVRGVIEFPFITDFYTNVAGEFAPKIINKATLVLPVQDFQADPFDPTTLLFMGRIVDEKLTTFVVDYNFGPSLTINSVIYDAVNKEYRFNITQEIQAILNGEVENLGYRIYIPAFFASSIERIIFNGPNSDLKDKLRLEITYTEY
ncbi:MAG: hypothetical protein ACI8ZM_000857 [Crocinitomix sp.]|jgi:hypothetical protein